MKKGVSATDVSVHTTEAKRNKKKISESWVFYAGWAYIFQPR
jgi:hypothetical protein